MLKEERQKQSLWTTCLNSVEKEESAQQNKVSID